MGSFNDDQFVVVEKEMDVLVWLVMEPFGSHVIACSSDSLLVQTVENFASFLLRYKIQKLAEYEKYIFM